MNKTFTAPQAHVLIVDDMPVNQKITAELLRPLNMTIDIASNGEEALDLIFHSSYDLVFMDNMMPVMDGMEATFEIRKRPEREYQKLPVIAITSNTSDEVIRRMEEIGFSDFLTKPFRIEEILSCIRKWLPPEMIQESYEDSSSSCKDKVDRDVALNVQIPGIDSTTGRRNAGGSALYIELLGDVHDIIMDKCALIVKCLLEKDIKNYTIQVHSLKTTCRIIGALDLAEEFFFLENLSSSGNIELLIKETTPVLASFKALLPYLEPYASRIKVAEKEFDKDEVSLLIMNLISSMNDFNLTSADEYMKSLISFRYPEELSDKIKELEVLVTNLDYDEALVLAKNILDALD